MRAATLLAALLLGGCTMQRGRVTVINQHELRIHRFSIESPDFQRQIHGLPPGGDFRLREDISFRRAWRYTAELDDGRLLRGDSGPQRGGGRLVEVVLEADGGFRTRRLESQPSQP